MKARTTADIRARLGERVLDYARESAMPMLFEPMLATLSDTPFSDPAWIYERKFDGIRLLVFRDGDHVELFTRNGKPRENRFPELVESFRRQPCKRYVLDGEVVAFEGRVTSFARLQDRAGIADPDEARATGIQVYFYAFDCPWLAGLNLGCVPLRQRKAVLRDVFDFTDPLRFTTHHNEAGEALLSRACGRGWEGVIAKRADSGYRRGRSKRWLKLKCEHGQEFVVGGFSEPQGERQGFGALLLGYYEGGALRYAGRVGTGFDEARLARMRERFDTLERAESPFVEKMREEGVHWIEPRPVVEVRFTEWTADGKLRHPRFIAERDDKDAGDVVRESAGRVAV